MNYQPEREFRNWDDPRRHVPRIVYIPEHAEHPHGTWQMSVRDWQNCHHVRCMDTWTEAKTTASGWAVRNNLHGCTIHTTEEKKS